MPAPPKYRPYFTASELSEVISALKSQPTSIRLPLIRYLEWFAIEIERGTRMPNHISIPTKRESFIASLELESKPEPVIKQSVTYNKWLSSPSKCTPDEIIAALEYRYTNDLMSPEEERDYESANGM